ncbi:MAG: DUF6468 domain-containing protein [Asticcacaulis sp.]
MTNLIMDVILMGLLVAALLFGMRLDKRLKALRAAHEGFAKAVHELDDAAIRAHGSLQALRANADESQDLLHGRILAAREVQQKLDVQLARAERMQKELDRGLITYAAARPQPEPVRSEPAKPAEATESIRPAHYTASVKANPVRPAPLGRPRDPFARDVVSAPLHAADPRAPMSRLPDIVPEDETEIMDKVQISELVVANLNEMIRTLNLPTRRPESLEDELFGDEQTRRARPQQTKR